ncbi:hypothetical protein A3K81_05950 [Candidatus Bathyarchaeota archaeon RBG_13_60_20]|nr:MAG: hypothetical protein A3K81_05950 [Candidatus Bathyarchaeota archaeon RBG_13_60_20]
MRLPRVILGLACIHNVVFGAVFFATAGIKGFQGVGGEDAMLFQLVGYASIAMVLAGLVSLYAAARPSRRTAAVAGALVLVTGIPLILFTIFLNGAANVVLGLAAVLASRGIRD